MPTSKHTLSVCSLKDYIIASILLHEKPLKNQIELKLRLTCQQCTKTTHYFKHLTQRSKRTSKLLNITRYFFTTFDPGPVLPEIFPLGAAVLPPVLGMRFLSARPSSTFRTLRNNTLHNYTTYSQFNTERRTAASTSSPLRCRGLD